jgi:hypothetical protein
LGSYLRPIILLFVILLLLFLVFLVLLLLGAVLIRVDHHAAPRAAAQAQGIALCGLCQVRPAAAAHAQRLSCSGAGA